ncbi:DNA-binding protein [Sistotremastrum niveocremeum HHB9708]|uniref:DNA-binding protein n=1 Tax=Sistotremastrum niveocremeum HHB9708 TaxID=1314777 RepID=A0A164XKP7_9AGAM|nr:DNA-binding protein [Sistotremastrum niveocremeum HHB9708]
MTEPTLSYNQVVKAIADFIEVAIHNILYVRHLYPADLFVRRKRYEVPVFQARHPDLISYISGAMKAVAAEMKLGHVEKVIVVLKKNDNVAMERFIFSIQNMLTLDDWDLDQSVEEAMTSQKLGQYFRAFLVKLAMIESSLGPLNLGDNGTFAIILELENDAAPTATEGENEPPKWMPALYQHTTIGTSDASELHFIRAVDTGIINLSFAIQETGEKIDRDASQEGIETKRNPEDPPDGLLAT